MDFSDPTIWGIAAIVLGFLMVVRAIERASFAQNMQLQHEMRMMKEDIMGALDEIRDATDRSSHLLEDIRLNTDTSSPTDWDD